MRLITPFLVLFSLSLFAETHVDANLLSDRASVKKGESFYLGVHLKMEDHWHTYWENPGFAGFPTTWEIEPVPGLDIQSLQFPAPKEFDEDGFVTYGYDVEALLTARAVYTGDASEITIKGVINWLECKEICVPGREEVVLKLKVGESTPDNTPLFEKYLARTPVPFNDDAPFTFEADMAIAPDAWTGSLVITPKSGQNTPKSVTFFPLKNDEADLKTINQSRDGDAFKLELTWEGYGDPLPGDLVVRGVVLLESASGFHASRLQLYPKGAIAETAPAKNHTATVVSEVGGTNYSLWYILILAFLGGMILNLMPCVLPVISLKVYALINEAGESPLRRIQMGWAYAAGIMISFLALSLLFVVSKAAGDELGVGAQLSNPRFVIFLCVLLFVMALSFFGIFEIGSPNSDKLNQLSQRSGFQGAFFLGVLTTILSTPCTAPGLGAAYGWALSQSSGMIILIFQVIAFGLAFPYLMLVYSPSLLKFLPKPGPWMLHFKISMGFLMLATMIWLLGVLAGMTGISGVVGVMTLLLVLGQAAYVLGQSWHTGARLRGLTIALLLTGGGYYIGMHKLFNIQDPTHEIRVKLEETRLASLSGADLESEITTADKIAWVPFSQENLDYFRSKNRLVFLDFTAEWCLTCKANEKMVIDTRKIREAFANKNVVVMRGDYTNQEDEDTVFIKSFNRAGVPLYVVYPGQGKPILLPETITRSIVANALDDAHRSLEQSASN